MEISQKQATLLEGAEHPGAQVNRRPRSTHPHREPSAPLILLFSLRGKYPAYLRHQCPPLCQDSFEMSTTPPLCLGSFRGWRGARKCGPPPHPCMEAAVAAAGPRGGQRFQCGQK